MKISDEFIPREVARQLVIVPFTKRGVWFNGIMTLSDCALLWRLFKKDILEGNIGGENL